METASLLQTVALKSVKCYAYHGFYPEENIIGQYYDVDVMVKFRPHSDSSELNNSVNYEILNQIILREMNTSQKLLETVVQNILQEILLKFPSLLFIQVGIHKINPPMPGQVGESFVSLTYDLLKG
ncbi:MAG: dihydroneopterin aldolase [Pedobacter sp.]|nr:MAG: dihydroneopterin aldolase [Pedobacter sp.]